MNSSTTSSSTATLPVTTVVPRGDRDLHVKIGLATRDPDGSMRVHLDALPAGGDLFVPAPLESPAPAAASQAPRARSLPPGVGDAAIRDTARDRVLADGTRVSLAYGFLGAESIVGALDEALLRPGRVVEVVACAAAALDVDAPAGSDRPLARLSFGVVPIGHELGGAVCELHPSGAPLVEHPHHHIASSRDAVAVAAARIALTLVRRAGDPRAVLLRVVSAP